MSVKEPVVPQFEYPDPVIRQSFNPALLDNIVDNGTSPPSLSFKQFLTLFTAGPNGEIVDFCNTRIDCAEDMSSLLPVLRYVADGAAIADTGTAIATGVLPATTVVQTLTVDISNNTVPANALVFLDLGAALPGTGSVAVDVGRRAVTN